MSQRSRRRSVEIETAPGVRGRKGSRIIEIEAGQKRRKEKREELINSEEMRRKRERIRKKQTRPKMSTEKKLAICTVLVIAVLLFVHNGYQIIDLNLDKAVYEKEYEEKLAEKARLEKELGSVDELEYIEQQARDRFHMLRDGEILYVFAADATAEAQ